MLSEFVLTGGLIAGIISIIVGILVIVWPRLIAYVVGGYLVVIGIFALVTVLR